MIAINKLTKLVYNAPQMTKYSQHFINNIILISINIKNQKPLKKGDL